MTIEEFTAKGKKAYQELSNMMLEVWHAAGLENATIEDVEKDRKAPFGEQKCSVCRGNNDRQYIWYLDEENNREACMDKITRRFLTHEQIVKVFGLDEEEPEISQEMSNAINIICAEVNPWEMTAEQKRELKLAKKGNRGALCDLLTSLGMESDERFTGFYDEQDGGTDPDTIRTLAELETNKELVWAFIEDQKNQLAGLYMPGDKQYTAAVIADAESHRPERWTADTKREYVSFLASRAELYVEQENERKAHPRGGWHNPASAENGKKGGRPKKAD